VIKLRLIISYLLRVISPNGCSILSQLRIVTSMTHNHILRVNAQSTIRIDDKYSPRCQEKSSQSVSENSALAPKSDQNSKENVHV
jgi:hypothetical protein